LKNLNEESVLFASASLSPPRSLLSLSLSPAVSSHSSVEVFVSIKKKRSTGTPWHHSSLLGGSLTTTPFSLACLSTSARNCLSNCVRCSRSPSRRSASMAVTLRDWLVCFVGKKGKREAVVSAEKPEREGASASLSWLVSLKALSLSRPPSPLTFQSMRGRLLLFIEASLDHEELHEPSGLIDWRSE